MCIHIFMCMQEMKLALKIEDKINGTKWWMCCEVILLYLMNVSFFHYNILYNVREILKVSKSLFSSFFIACTISQQAWRKIRSKENIFHKNLKHLSARKALFSFLFLLNKIFTGDGLQEPKMKKIMAKFRRAFNILNLMKSIKEKRCLYLVEFQVRRKNLNQTKKKPKKQKNLNLEIW